MPIKEFKVTNKYYNDGNQIVAVDFENKHTHEDGVTYSIHGGQFEFKESVMSLALPTSSSTDADIEAAIRDSEGLWALDDPDQFHENHLNTRSRIDGYKKVFTADSARAERDMLLAQTDWWALSDLAMTQEQIDYRKALRDITSQVGFPESIVWPVKP